MESIILLAIIAFSKGQYRVNHYPIQIEPWISNVSYSASKPGRVVIELKSGTFDTVPKCKWKALNTDSNAAGSVTYHSKNKIELSFYEKQKGKSESKDLDFILSCKK